jgi:parvulin-like peptidyl-prolyl isomerase
MVFEGNRPAKMAVAKNITAKPNRKEISFFYKTHRSQFQAPERIHALHIVKNIDPTTEVEKARKAMESAMERLRAGEDFARVADDISDCAGNGGDLGWFARGVMVEEFEDVVFELQPGETSGVFETRFGLHIACVLERREAGIAPLGEVYDLIADMLVRQREERTMA